VLAASALIAPAAQGDTSDRPGTWASRASATAVGVMFNTVPQQVVPEIVNVAFPDSDTQFDASIAKARASTLYPGLLVTQGANLTCQFSCAPVPPYPLTAYADGQAPDAKIATGQSVPVGPGGLEAGTAVAHVGDDGTTARAVNGRFDLSGSATSAAAALALRKQITAIVKGPVAAASIKPSADDASLIHVDSAVSETANTFKGGTLVVTATSTLKGVHLLGGNIDIESIVSTATSTSDGQSAKVNRSLTIGGVTVAGQPAHLDDKGLAIGPSGSQGGDGFDALNNALKTALGAAGIDIHALTGSQAVQGSSGSASIEGVLVSGKSDGVAGNGAIAGVLLGKAGVENSAAPFDALGADAGDLGDVGGITGDAGAITDTGGLGDVSLPSVSGATAALPSASSGGGAATHRQGASTAPDSQTANARAVAFVDPAAGRLHSLYLALALAAVGLALGWRRILPT
jgi:hypothetical protein